MFKIISEELNSVVVHKRTLDDGTRLEEIGDEGLKSIIRQILAEETEQAVDDFKRKLEEAATNKRRVEMQVAEIENQKKLRLEFIEIIARCTSVKDFQNDLVIADLPSVSGPSI